MLIILDRIWMLGSENCWQITHFLLPWWSWASLAPTFSGMYSVSESYHTKFIGSFKLANSLDYDISIDDKENWMLRDISWIISFIYHCAWGVTILLQWIAVLLPASYRWRSLRWSPSTICLWGRCLELWGWASVCHSCSSWTRTSQLLSWMLNKTSRWKKHQLYIPNSYCCIHIIWK